MHICSRDLEGVFARDLMQAKGGVCVYTCSLMHIYVYTCVFIHTITLLGPRRRICLGYYANQMRCVCMYVCSSM